MTFSRKPFDQAAIFSCDFEAVIVFGLGLFEEFEGGVLDDGEALQPRYRQPGDKRATRSQKCKHLSGFIM